MKSSVSRSVWLQSMLKDSSWIIWHEIRFLELFFLVAFSWYLGWAFFDGLSHATVASDGFHYPNEYQTTTHKKYHSQTHSFIHTERKKNDERKKRKNGSDKKWKFFCCINCPTKCLESHTTWSGFLEKSPSCFKCFILFKKKKKREKECEWEDRKNGAPTKKWNPLHGAYGKRMKEKKWHTPKKGQWKWKAPTKDKCNSWICLIKSSAYFWDFRIFIARLFI